MTHQQIIIRIAVCHILLLILLSALPVHAESGPPAEIKNKHILVLHSYAADYAWTSNLNSGVMAVLAGLDWTNSVRVEYMDTKYMFSPEYYSVLFDLLLKKYKAIQFDGIIATDNNALNFLEQFKDRLFPLAPVVATGINGVGSIQLPRGAKCIIAEEADHNRTLNQALHLRPLAQKGYIVVDSSTTGRAIMAEIKKSLPDLKTNVAFQFLDQLTVKELLDFAASRDDRDFIYLVPFFRDAAGIYYDQGYVASALSQVSTVPVFVSWAFQLNTGVLGGAVVSGENLGERAATTLLSVLEGEDVPALIRFPKGIITNRYDYNVMAKFALPASLLPSEVSLVNKPVSFFDRHKRVLLPGAVIILVLLLLLLLILKNLNNQKIINTHSQDIINLDREVIETQRELVTTLGEVIETRSWETGNHVKRVAKISRLIGAKFGLSSQELDILEAASPLHDVGKIGIPDDILHRQGKLTNEEWSKMQLHTAIGRDILKKSDRTLLSSACSIAYQHHERWDGSGYPEGLQGESISLFARITMLADVYDALSMDRCYKKAWPEDKIVSYIKRETGRLFDPGLAKAFFDNYDEIRAVRIRYTD